MQRHLKTLLLHHELKHKEGFINDPESPGLLSVALVNWTIVCSAFAAQVGLFIMCLAHVGRVYYRFIMFCAFIFCSLGHNLTQKTEKFELFWEEIPVWYGTNALDLLLRVIHCLIGDEMVFVFSNRCGENKLLN